MQAQILELAEKTAEISALYEKRIDTLEQENEKLKEMLDISLTLLKTYDYQRAMRILKMIYSGEGDV